MTATRRVQQQPAFILHHRPFRDSSQILDVISHDHGKLALVARGSRGAKSRLRGVLRPFMPLSMSWVQRSDLGTLTGAEIRGAPISLSGDALLSGFYVNELLLHLLHRHDPQPGIFDIYGETIQTLAATENVAACLRQFEIELLRQVGYAVILDHEFDSQEALKPAQNYEYRFEQGPVAVNRSDGALVFSGAQLLAIGELHFDEPDVLRAANRLLRALIAFHLGGKELKSRKVLVDLHRARIPDSKGEAR
ncbi:MAG: DNA repair protein RecO [Proteobacteria bacterium]|nr:DNA repair protein RecO [Pseudomonadota bacterium]